VTTVDRGGYLGCVEGLAFEYWFTYRNTDGTITVSAELPNADDAFRQADWLAFCMNQGRGQ
jgi:hypothetical protein